MPTYGKRPRRNLPPPLAGSEGRARVQARPVWGEETNKNYSSLRGRGKRRAQLAQASDAERKLWIALRRKQIDGMRFRRQFPLGPYFGDFVCLPARLVVEIDGSQHGEEMARDHRRTA